MTALTCLLIVVIGVANCANSLQGLTNEHKRNVLMTVAADFTNGQITIKRKFAPDNITMKDGQWKKMYPTEEELLNLTKPESKTHKFIPKISSTNGLEIQIVKIKPSEPKPTNLSTSEQHDKTNITDLQTKLENPPDVIEATETVENKKGSRGEEGDKAKRELEDIAGTNNILEENKKDNSDGKVEDYIKWKNGERENIETGIKNSNDELKKKAKGSSDGVKDTSEFIEENKLERNERVSEPISEESKVKLKNIDILESGNSEVNKNWKEDEKDSRPWHKATRQDDGNLKDEQKKSRGITKIMNQNPVIIQTAVEAKPLEEILRKSKRISGEKKEEQDWKLLKELKETKRNDTEIDVEYRKQRNEKNPTKVYEPCKGFSFVLLERCPDIKKDPNAYNCRTVYVRNMENECTYFVCAPVQNRHFGAGSHMEPQLMYCPPGTYFSTQLLVCDYMDNASHEVFCPVPEKVKNGNNSTSSIG